MELEGANGITLWKGLTKKGERYEKGSRLIMGGESTISFWHVIWLGEPLPPPLSLFLSLSLSRLFFFSEIYSLVNNKNAWILDYLQRSEARIH